jgi:hypothetical protein
MFMHGPDMQPIPCHRNAFCVLQHLSTQLGCDRHELPDVIDTNCPVIPACCGCNGNIAQCGQNITQSHTSRTGMGCVSMGTSPGGACPANGNPK